MPTDVVVTGFTELEENFAALSTPLSVYDFSVPRGLELGAPISCEEPQGPRAGQKMKFHTINPETKQREVREIGG